MAAIYMRLSAKVQKETGLAEVLLCLRNGKDYYVRAKSGIFVTPDNFRNGGIVVNRRKVGNDVTYHEEQLRRMNELCAFVLRRVMDTPKGEICTEWFKEVVERFHHPERFAPGAKKSHLV